MKNQIIDYKLMKASELRANPQNWRTHPDHQRKPLEALLSEVGWVAPVIYNQRTGNLIDGHLRTEIAGDELVPVVIVDVSERDERKILATFDPISGLAGMDAYKLDELLRELETSSPDLQAMLDSMEADVEALLAELNPPPVPDAPDAQIDRAEELLAVWQVERGDVWEIPSASVKGKCHRVMCGDSTSGEDVARLLNGDKPRLMVTDPPYGVEYDQTWRSNNRIGAVSNDDRADWLEAYRNFPGQVVYCWHAGWHASIFQWGLEQCGFEVRAYIIWNKPVAVFSQGHYHWKHEPCWYAVRAGETADWIGDRKQTTVWDIGSDHDAPGNHSTQKPVECMARPIRNHAGDVYDPFTGSGTTLVACEQVGRVGYGMEIEPKYVAVTLQRLADMGLEPLFAGIA